MKNEHKIGYSKKKRKHMEMPGIEPGASYMQSMRSTTELHPLYDEWGIKKIDP